MDDLEQQLQDVQNELKKIKQEIRDKITRVAHAKKYKKKTDVIQEVIKTTLARRMVRIATTPGSFMKFNRGIFL